MDDKMAKSDYNTVSSAWDGAFMALHEITSRPEFKSLDPETLRIARIESLDAVLKNHGWTSDEFEEAIQNEIDKKATTIPASR